MGNDPSDGEIPFAAADFFAFRTPLLPFDTLLEWAAGLRAARAIASGDLERAVQSDRRELTRRLRATVARAEVREAVFLGSQATSSELDRWLPDPERQDARLEQTLARYLQRMAGRATPFGLFAGTSLGRMGEALNLEVGFVSECRRYSRLDNDHLFALGEYAAGRDDVRRALLYRPNSSLYRLAGRWRYVRSVMAGHTRQFNLVAVDGDEFLDAVVARAGRGAAFDDLTRHVLNCDADGDITIEEAAAYVGQLIDQQLLVCDLEPIVTGPEPVDDMIAQLRSIAPGHEITRRLEEIRDALAEIDRSSIGVDLRRYRQIAEQVDAIGVPSDPARLFQVDLIRPAPRATLSREITGEIGRAVDILHRLAPPPGADTRQQFRDAFIARYERRMVPLTEVLDEESGIGFDRSMAATAEHAPLLNGIPSSTSSGGSLGSWTARDAFLLTKLEMMRREGGTTLELSASDIDQLAAQNRRPLPDAFSAFAVISASGQESGPDFQVLVDWIAGPSGARMLGRFCHADPELRARVVDHLAAEESIRPDAIYAEVVHLPDGRAGNVIARPVLRQFEIPYLGRSGAPDTRQIPISDLLVTVDDDRIVLRSVRLNAEVIPRMTNAHNYQRGPGTYRFLCGLQAQTETGAAVWQWGALDSLAGLPRVTHGRIVLARARWRIDRKQIEAFSKGPLHEQFASIHRWKNEQQVPRFVALADSDNELPIDFENVLSVEAFLHVVKTRPSCTVVEMFPSPDALCAHGPDGRFVHEVVVPFVRRVAAKARKNPAPAVSVPRTQRSFPPGSEWLYVKLYAGTSSVDAILAEPVSGLVRRHVETNAIDRWFFIRYGDPEWHLRLRLHGEPGRLYAEVLPDLSTLLAPALADRRIWKIQVDTYEPEIERYGGDLGLSLSEEMFWRDSDAVLRILGLLPGDAGMDARWLLCLESWDLLLSDLGFSLESKRQFTQDMRSRHARMSNANKAVDRALGDRFRRERKAIEGLLDDRPGPSEEISAALAALRARSIAWAPTIRALRQRDQAGQLTMPLTSLAASFLHMHANRLLRSAQVPQEFVLYDFLDRVYESRLARARRNAATVATR